MSVGDVIQITTWCQADDQAGLNVFHYRVTAVSSVGSNSTSNLAAGLQSAGLPAAMKAALSSKAYYKGMLVRRLYTDLSVDIGDATGGGQGTVSGDMLPRQICGFIRKQSDVPGRRLSGRFYMPFPGEGSNDPDSIPTETYQGLLQDIATILVSTRTWGTGGSAEPVIWDRNTPANTRTYSTTRVAARWATQRRRGSFGKTNISPF